MTRQDLYTMLTRGRAENHAYLPAGATAGDAHQLIHPDAIHPQTAREILEQVLTNDGAATSATSELETAHDPSTLLRQARDRYDDALNLACEHVVGTTTIDAIETHAEQLAPGITDQPAWPTLRQRLIHTAANNNDPLDLLNYAADRGRLDDAHDPAATLTWRLDMATDPQHVTSAGLPFRVQQHPTWSAFLNQRHDAVTETRQGALSSYNEHLSYVPEAKPTAATTEPRRTPSHSPPTPGPRR